MSTITNNHYYYQPPDAWKSGKLKYAEIRSTKSKPVMMSLAQLVFIQQSSSVSAGRKCNNTEIRPAKIGRFIVMVDVCDDKK